METPADDLAPRPPAAPAAPAASAVTEVPRAAEERAAYYRARAAEAMVRARALVGRPWTSDPGLRVQVEAILAMSPEDRLRQLEEQVATLAALRPLGPAVAGR
ncbi:hypothetical protein [Parafrankia elaeagni]|uniref:hypothetical protein n=1 Tax=Parafrankia elaeagni TaxID=222534 RepID=UPI0003658762|nr:hypothetical protein [Parafrankia elaeagni]